MIHLINLLLESPDGIQVGDRYYSSRDATAYPIYFDKKKNYVLLGVRSYNHFNSRDVDQLEEDGILDLNSGMPVLNINYIDMFLARAWDKPKVLSFYTKQMKRYNLDKKDVDFVVRELNKQGLKIDKKTWFIEHGDQFAHLEDFLKKGMNARWEDHVWDVVDYERSYWFGREKNIDVEKDAEANKSRFKDTSTTKKGSPTKKMTLRQRFLTMKGRGD